MQTSTDKNCTVVHFKVHWVLIYVPRNHDNGSALFVGTGAIKMAQKKSVRLCVVKYLEDVCVGVRSKKQELKETF